MQSYSVLAFDYILKPIDTKRFAACIKRLLSQKNEKPGISVLYLGTETKILLSNIHYLESNLRKVIFALSENRQIEVVGKLTDYEDFLLSHGFCRCHKSFLVNISHKVTLNKESSTVKIFNGLKMLDEETPTEPVTETKPAEETKPAQNNVKFADVKADAYYADAVKWAVEKNITAGTSATTFSPDEICSRGQIVTFLNRAIQ